MRKDLYHKQDLHKFYFFLIPLILFLLRCVLIAKRITFFNLFSITIFVVFHGFISNPAQFNLAPTFGECTSELYG